MSYKSSPQENPVGQDSPTFAFPFSKGQVFVVLMLLAVGLTAWKQYEANTIAPRTPVRWQPISVESLEQAAQRHVDVLLVFDPVDAEELRLLNERFASSEFRKAVYLSKMRPFRIKSTEILDEATVLWLEKRLESIPSDAIIWIPKGDFLHRQACSSLELDDILEVLTSSD